MNQVDEFPFKKPIYVTRPQLPPLSEVTKLLEGIWERKILTNDGPLHQQLEQELARYLGVKHISLFANGTLALLVGLKALRLQGEVITTPFSFVATSEALSWNNLQPVFADINPQTFGLDPDSVISRITPQTSAILAVHCYGLPCDVEALERIADDYNLSLIYDAAHAFGVDCHCGSLLEHGDLSILSFHATKVFTTFEGGAIVSPDAKTKRRIDRLKNFGFVDEATVAVNGINAKMSELHAAIGLAQLPRINESINERKRVAETYHSTLCHLEWVELPEYSLAKKPNYAYYPILISRLAPTTRDQVVNRLEQSGIFPRRYFYPLISDFQYYKSCPGSHPDGLPMARKTAERVLCLPIYPDLSNEAAKTIATMVIGCGER